MDSTNHEIERMQQALLESRDRAMEDRDKALQTVAQVNLLIRRVDVRLAEIAQIKGHPPAMCDVIEQLSKKDKNSDRGHVGNPGAEHAVPAVVLVASKR